jgi:hypothetical protein
MGGLGVSKRFLVVLLIVIGVLAGVPRWAGSANAADAEAFVGYARYSHWWDNVPSGHRIRFYWFDATGVTASGAASTTTRIEVDVECAPDVPACDPTPLGDHSGTGTATREPGTRETVVTGSLPGCEIAVRFTAYQLQTGDAAPFYAEPTPIGPGSYGAYGRVYEWGRYTGTLCGLPFETPWPMPEGAYPAFIEYTPTGVATDVTGLGLGGNAINSVGAVTREQTVAHTVKVDYP